MTPPPRPKPISARDVELVARTASALDRLAGDLATAGLRDERLGPIVDAMTAAVDRSFGWLREFAPAMAWRCQAKVSPPPKSKMKPAAKVQRPATRPAQPTLFDDC